MHVFGQSWSLWHAFFLIHEFKFESVYQFYLLEKPLRALFLFQHFYIEENITYNLTDLCETFVSEVNIDGEFGVTIVGIVVTAG